VRAALAAANVARGSHEVFTEKRLPLAAARALVSPRKRRWVAGNVLAIPLRMRSAQVAPLYERVPPMLYGGTERVVSHLVEEQVRRGHEVTLFASGDSRTGAALVSPFPRALRLDLGTSDMLAPTSSSSRRCSLGTLRFLAAHQGREDDEFTDQRPRRPLWTTVPLAALVAGR
jgi:hypothetical protein